MSLSPFDEAEPFSVFVEFAASCCCCCWIAAAAAATAALADPMEKDFE